MSMQESVLYIVLALLGVVIYLLLNPRKNRKETDDFEKTIKDLKTEIENYRKDDLKKQGSFEEALRNAQTDRQSFIDAAKELRQTLVSGGGQAQGAWGEMILKYILTEKLQFTEGQEFHVHENFDTEEGRLEPDVIIHLPGKRDAIVDSKVSLKAWNDYVNAKDEHSRKSALDEHRKSIKRHIDSLADKKYQDIKDLNTLDTVIMFCPNENAISSLGDTSRKMMDYAISKKITLVGPSMLYYALKTVEHFWKSEKQNKNKLAIIDLANKVSSQAVDIYEAAKKTQDSITKTSKGVDDIMSKIKDGKGSFLSKIIKMNKIGGLSPRKEIPADIKDEDLSNNDDPDPPRTSIRH